MFFIIFIFILPTTILVILLLTTKQKKDSESTTEVPTEVCALCHEDFPMTGLLEKEVGDYGRVYCFCRQCIEELYIEIKNRNGIEIGE